MNAIRRITLLVLLLSALGLAGRGIEAQAPATRPVPTPDSFFGFQLGSDRHIARWDRIVEYYKLLERQSPKIKVVDMGPTTMGHPFLLVVIHST